MVLRHKDLYAGLIFIVIGISAVVVSVRNYPLGHAMRMGPGYVPAVLGGLLALVGLVILVRSVARSGASIGRLALRSLGLIVLSLVLFGYLLKPLGLVLAIAVLVFVGALGGWEFRWREVTLLAGALVVFSVAAFVWGLGLPFPVWPGE